MVPSTQTASSIVTVLKVVTWAAMPTDRQLVPL